MKQAIARASRGGTIATCTALLASGLAACGNEQETSSLLVNGKPGTQAGTTSSAILTSAAQGYRTYVIKEALQLLGGTRVFVAALRRGDVQQAEALFGPVRRHYEAIEPVAESFGDLDPRIDARINDVPSVKQWTGFHRIEQILWLHNTTQGTTRYATQLLADVTTLSKKVKTLSYQTPQLANGAVELLNEVANSKITGEEDRYSHTDLSDFEGNLTGARVAFQLLRPALAARGEDALANNIQARFATVQHGLDAYRRDTPLGFAYYGELTPADRKRFAQQVDALAEPLSTVAAKATG